MAVSLSQKDRTSESSIPVSKKKRSQTMESGLANKESVKKPKMESRDSATSSKVKDGQFPQLKSSQTTSSIPKLGRKNKSSSHQRQYSEPTIARIKAEGQSSHNKKKEWIATFDALSEKKAGHIEVEIDSGNQFKTFLEWSRGKKIHTLKINNSLSGLERDVAALQASEINDKVREAYRKFPGITDVLHALPKLQSLDISRCDPSEPDLKNFLFGLKSGDFQLTSLKADHIYWGSEDVVKSLIDVIEGPSKLIQLSLKFAMGEKLTPHALLKALKKNVVLEDVELSVSAENGAVDPKDIAVTVLKNSTLKKLTIHTKKFMSVTENRFGDETSVDFKMNSLVSNRFKTAFQRNNTLEELHIHGASLPSEIIQTITASMKNNKTLQSVTLVESAENKVAVENLQAVLFERRHQGKASDAHS